MSVIKILTALISRFVCLAAARIQIIHVLAAFCLSAH